MARVWVKTAVWLSALLLAVPTFVGCGSSYRGEGGVYEQDEEGMGVEGEEGEEGEEEEEEYGGDPKSGGETCFNASTVSSFDYMRPRYVYVNVTGEKHYLLTLAQECINLENAMNMSIRSRFEQVCSRSEDSISYTALGRAEECRIVNVHEVQDRAAAEALIKKETTQAKH